MVRLTLALSLILLLSFSSMIHVNQISASSDVCNGADYGTSGEFDFYVLEFSWPAQFCSTHTSYPGCQQPTSWQLNNFTLHGLWPNYNQQQGGSHYWPQCCDTGSGANLDPTIISSLLPSLQQYWPSEQNPSPNPNDLDNSLWGHEWAKHGTCSGLNQNTYFQDAMNLIASDYLATPNIVNGNIGGSVDRKQLEAIYNQGNACSDTSGDCLVGVGCDKQGTLSGLQTCWTKDFTQIICPAQALEPRCQLDTLQILGFGGSTANVFKREKIQRQH